MATVRERLDSFMKERKVTRQQLADALSTPVSTMDSWLYEGVTPPSAVLAMLGLIENDSRIRTRLGLVHRREHRRSNGFKPGNPWRFNDPRRSKYLETCKKRKSINDKA
jgi:hypothetical protein